MSGSIRSTWSLARSLRLKTTSDLHRILISRGNASWSCSSSWMRWQAILGVWRKRCRGREWTLPPRANMLYTFSSSREVLSSLFCCKSLVFCIRMGLEPLICKDIEFLRLRASFSSKLCLFWLRIFSGITSNKLYT